MKEEKVTKPYSVNEYLKQQMKDNALFNQWFNLGKQSAFSNQFVQIQKFDSVHSTNKFLKDIPRENIIEIKPLENNTYLVIYGEDKE